MTSIAIAPSGLHMRRKISLLMLALAAWATPAIALPEATDTSPHKTSFIRVANDITLEVLDWGGQGSPIVFLAGGSSTAHVFDKFALNFTSRHHVYGITRRGLGRSSAPPPEPENYDANVLADDVIAVLDAVKIEKPVLIGHSFAGAEMTSIGTRYSERVAGLVYMDASYPRAFYDAEVPLAYEVDAAVVSRDLRRFQWASPKEASALIEEIQRTLPSLQKGLDWYAKTLQGMPEFKSQPDPWAIAHANLGGDHQYGNVKPPMLIFFAVPNPCQPDCKNNDDMWQAAEELQRKSIEAKYPEARIVRLANANHAIWTTNEADVTREVNAFLQRLLH
ncbi:MAG TPA: alpha/beta hydrolase [Steroidobacteraceae bacterium]|jgi:pimeloyl-ACP methyl ester carboxylesterase